MRFNEAILEIGFDYRARILSDKTFGNDQKQLKYLQRYLEEELQIKEVEDVRSFHVEQFLSMMDDKKRKARYINSQIEHVTRLWYTI